MRLDDLDDGALLAALHTSPEAFAALYRRYERPVLAYFGRRVSGAEAAVDLTAETFACALEGLRGGASPEHFPAWLFTIARRRLIDAYRRGVVEDGARRRLAMEPVRLERDALEQVIALAGDEQLHELVAALPVDQRVAVLARVLDERDYRELAGELSCSELVVRKRVSRGLATLRARLEGGAR